MMTMVNKAWRWHYTSWVRRGPTEWTTRPIYNVLSHYSRGSRAHKLDGIPYNRRPVNKCTCNDFLSKNKDYYRMALCALLRYKGSVLLLSQGNDKFLFKYPLCRHLCLARMLNDYFVRGFRSHFFPLVSIVLPRWSLPSSWADCRLLLLFLFVSISIFFCVFHKRFRKAINQSNIELSHKSISCDAVDVLFKHMGRSD